MKQHLDIRHEGTLGDSGRTKMRFDEDSIDHLMSVLIDLYSDKPMAVIREYSTNALDSHRAAGNPAPIEIERPTDMVPTFIVRDHGVGMSVDMITNQFSLYGWSSKRDTDDEVGMLGLGCKSALTYASQFTFVSRHNGVQATVLVTRMENGAGAVQVVDTKATDAPNGVEVQIPVTQVWRFNDKIDQFFRFWEPGTVLIDGEAPTYIGDKPGSKILDSDVIIVPGLKSDFILMGNVPYPVDEGQEPGRIATAAMCRHYGSESSGVIARVPIGSIDFTPNRESLRYSKRTREAIEAAQEFVNHTINRQAMDAVANARSKPEALKIAEEWRNVLGRNFAPTYQGEEVPWVFSLPNGSWLWTGAWEDTGSAKRTSMEIKAALNSIHVVGHKGNGVMKVTKARIMQFRQVFPSAHGNRSVYFHNHSSVANGWLDPATTCILTYDELRTIPLGDDEEEKKPRKRNSQKYRLCADNGDRYMDERPDPTRPLVWIEASRWGDRRDWFYEYAQIMGIDVAIVSKQSEKKFLREHPGIETLVEHVAREAPAWINKIDPDIVYFLKWETRNVWEESGFSQIPSKDLKDLHDREAVDIIRDITRRRHEYTNMERKHHIIEQVWHITQPRGANLPEFPKSDLGRTIAALTEKYPLIPSVVRGSDRYANFAHLGKWGHVIKYMNDAHLIRSGLHLHPATY